MPKIYRHAGGLFIEYRTKETYFRNKHDRNNEWRMVEYWMFGIRFDKKLYQYDTGYYDGHTYAALTILGVTFLKIYDYDSRSLEDWHSTNYR